MADYAGAVAALRTRFESGWAAATPVAFQNEKSPDKGNSPWVFFEMRQTTSEQRGAGLPGNQAWLTRGYIHAHIFVPLGYGLPETLRLAELAGEMFRAKTFYQDGAGAKVVCGAPQCDGGGTDADNGNWFRVTTTVPFEFFFFK